MGEGFQLFRIRGIPLRIHPSWFVILALATLAFRQQYSEQLQGPGGDGSEPLVWLLALATAVLLFVSVLLHELGHSFAALAQGVKVRSITLFLLGGVASIERESTTARGALIVAAAGPAVSLLLAAALISASHPASHLAPALGVLVSQLGQLNLVLGLFNLLPGLPLDGGLILKALVWQWTGSQRRGLQVATASGLLLSLVALGLGTVVFLRSGSIGGLWLMLLGWFGFGAARNQTQSQSLQRVLRELKVRDGARRRYRVLEPATSLRQLSRLRLADPEGLADWLLVCDGGRWRGLIDDAPLQSLPVQRWDEERIGDHLRPLSDLPAIRDDAPLWQAVLQLEAASPPRLLVLSAAGLPCGTIERPELAEAVLAKLGVRLPAPLLEAARRQGSYPVGLPLAAVAEGMLASSRAGDAPASRWGSNPTDPG